MEVRGARSDDLEPCLEIVCGLPDFFTADVPARVRGDLDRHEGWVLAEGEEIVAFAIIDRRPPEAAEILWIAVQPGRHRSGYGTRLLDHVLGALRDQGVALVEAKTLDRSADYTPYEATRAFWERNGFVQVDRIDEPPGWEPGNPAAVLVAALSTTR
jgi:ribosomal protein S18 acetylase RimI-like enzyme